MSTFNWFGDGEGGEAGTGKGKGGGGVERGASKKWFET